MRYFFLLYSFFISFSCFADLSTDTVYLTWQRQPDTTMTIQWISTQDQKQRRPTVFYRIKNDSNQWLTQQGFSTPLGTSKFLIHQVELTHLNPDTTYEFKISSPDKSPSWFFLTMQSDLKQPIRFVEGGDLFHDLNNPKDMERTSLYAAKTNPHFALLGGDIAYAVIDLKNNEKIEKWVNFIISWHKCMITDERRLIPVIASIGNHDIIGQFNQNPSKAKVFASLFPMPGNRLYNCLDFGNYLSLFILDSGHGNPVEGDQSKWLQEALQKRTEVLHRFAIYHVPAYPCIRSFDAPQSSIIRKIWVPLFEWGGIQLVFEHHDHAYKRTHPLLQNKVHPQGIVYIGDGGWGVDQPRKPSFWQKEPFYLAKFVSARHFVLVTIDGNRENVKAIDDTGKVLDEYDQVIVPQEAASMNAA